MKKILHKQSYFYDLLKGFKQDPPLMEKNEWSRNGILLHRYFDDLGIQFIKIFSSITITHKNKIAVIQFEIFVLIIVKDAILHITKIIIVEIIPTNINHQNRNMFFLLEYQ